MTKWGIFTLSQIPDQTRRVEVFYADLPHFDLAENLGHDKVRIAEHLFSNYDVVTSAQVYAAAITQRTKRIGIDTAVAVVPIYHSLRTASDFALTDIVSHGRLDFGIGRACPAHAKRAMRLAAERVPPYVYAHHALIGLRSRD